jgi:hypothetical protein
MMPCGHGLCSACLALEVARLKEQLGQSKTREALLERAIRKLEREAREAKKVPEW